MSKLVQFKCPEFVLEKLDGYVDERSRTDNFNRTDAILEAVKKYLVELGVFDFAPTIQVVQKKESI